MWKIANGLQTVSDCGRRSTGRPAARPRHLRSCPTHAARSGIAGAGSDGTAFPPLANPPVAPRESALLHSARPRHLRSCPTHAAGSGIAGAGSDGTAFPPLANPPVAPRESALLHSALFPLPLALPLFPLFITKLDHKKFQHCGCALNGPALQPP